MKSKSRYAAIAKKLKRLARSNTILESHPPSNTIGTTACFPSGNSMELQDQCFSIITSDRSLDLQVNAEVEKRDDWVRVFRLLALIRWLEDTAFADEQDIEEEEEEEEKEESDNLIDLNHSEDPLVPEHKPPSTPQPPSIQPPTSPSSKRRLVKNRRSSRRSNASIDLDAAMDELLDLDVACEQSELSRYVSMDTLSGIDLDKLYKEGPKTKVHKMLSTKISKQVSNDMSKVTVTMKENDADKTSTSKLEEKGKPRAQSSSHRDSSPVAMTGMPEEEDDKLRPRVSSVQTGDLNTLELGAFELPPSWKDANTFVEELKAQYVIFFF